MKRIIQFFGNPNPPGGRSRLPVVIAALAICAAIQFSPTPVEAQEFRLNLEAGGAVFVDEPQSERFGPGLHLAIRPGLELWDVLTLQWSYGLLWVGSGDEYDESGSAHSLTTGLRVRPFGRSAPESSQLTGLFVDFNVGYFRTGELDRFGFDTGIGYNFQVMPTFALGPFIRYIHIVQSDNLEGMDPHDAQALAFGVNLSFGPAHKEAEPTEATEPPETLECPVCPTCEPGPVCEPQPATDGSCPDWDNDGVCDDVDRCPTQAGPASNQGCPVDPCTGEPIVVLVQFELNSSGMPEHQSTGAQTMDPVLDAVADAIGKNDSCRVCIVGHTSEEGPAELNQTLSVERAKAVQDYMTARGVSKSQVPTAGMGAMCQLVPHDSLVMNRRVEFHRLEEGESCPTSCR